MTFNRRKPLPKKAQVYIETLGEQLRKLMEEQKKEAQCSRPDEGGENGEEEGELRFMFPRFPRV